MPAVVRTLLLVFMLVRFVTAAPAIYEGGVVNGADFTSTFSPGIIFSVFGTGLASSTLKAPGFPLPDSIDGVSVEVIDGGKTLKAPLFFVSAGQINALLPYEITGTTVEVRVKNAQGTSGSQTITVTSRSPRLLTKTMNGKGEPILTHADYTVVSQQSPAKAGEVVILFLTGLGAVEPALASGRMAGDGSASRPLNLVNADVAVKVNGKASVIYFKGLAPYFAGLYQINFQVPETTEPGEVLISVEIGGQASQDSVAFSSSIRLEALGGGTVPTSGGTVSAAGLTLTVPSGAFTAQRQISVYRAATGIPESSSRAGLVYGISGLPASLSAPINFSMDIPGASAVAGGAYAVLKMLGPSGGESWVKATVTGDRVTAAIPAHAAPVATTSKSSMRQAGEQEPDLAEILLLSIILGTNEGMSDKAEFRAIYAGQGASKQAVDGLLHSLEQAYEKLKSRGFSWPWAWPVEVRVDSGDKIPNFCGGMIVDGLWGKAPGMRVSPQELIFAPDGERFRAKAGHLLFHLIQSQYSANLGINARRTWLWMDEAAAFAFERDFDYSDPLVNHLSIRLARAGLELSARSDYAAELFAHGHHAARFLVLLDHDLKSGDLTWMSKVYNRKKGSADVPLPVKAMQDTQIDVGQAWRNHCNTEYVYMFIHDRQGIDASDVRGRSKTLQGVVNKPVSFVWDALELSAQLFEVVTPAAWPSSADLSVSVSPATSVWITLHTGVYDPSRGEMAYRTIAQGNNIVLKLPGSVIGNGPLYIVVSNSKALSPFNSVTPITITAVLKPRDEGFLPGLRMANYIKASIEAKPICDIKKGFENSGLCPYALLLYNQNLGGQSGYAPFSPTDWQQEFNVSSYSSAEDYMMTVKFSATGDKIESLVANRYWKGAITIGGESYAAENVMSFTLKGLPHTYPPGASPPRALHNFTADGLDAKPYLESFEFTTKILGVTVATVTGFDWTTSALSDPKTGRHETSTPGIRVLFDKY